MRRSQVCTLALLGLLAVGPSAAQAENCLRICGNDRLDRVRPTLRDQVRQAGAIVLAEVAGTPAPSGFHVLEVLKISPGLRPPDFIPPGCALNSLALGSRWILFCEIAPEGKIIFSTAFAASPGPLGYIKGLVQTSRDPVQSLAHCLRYLEHADYELAADAYTELSRAEGRHLRAAARGFPADRVAGWFGNLTNCSSRHNTYGRLLGCCGEARHADLLRRFLTDPERLAEMQTDGALVGYVLLRPEEGWPLICDLLRDPKKPPRARDSAVMAVRYFWDQRTDVLPRTDLLRAVVPLLNDAAFADTVIDDLRRWQRWELTDLVLRRWERLPPDDHNGRRAVLYFALSAPRPQAAAFVARLRRTERAYVADNEQLFRLLPKSPVP